MIFIRGPGTISISIEIVGTSRRIGDPQATITGPAMIEDS